MFKADFHIHTVLSPCGSLEMSPVNIVNTAKEKGLNIIGIADHNATHHTKLVKKLAAKENIFVMQGIEICTKEEIHCLAFFEKDDEVIGFQSYIDQHLPHIPNDPDKFGYQVVVDEEENIIDELPYILISGINQNIDQVKEKIKEFNGIFIPAHIDRSTFSLTSQLGFVPPDLNPDAFEISKYCTEEKIRKQYPYIADKRIIQDSDAHFLEDIGCVYNVLELKKLDFEHIRNWLTTI